MTSPTLEQNEVLSPTVARFRTQVRQGTYHRSANRIAEGILSLPVEQRPIGLLSPAARAMALSPYRRANHTAALRIEVQATGEKPLRGIRNAPEPRPCSLVRRHPLLWWRLVHSTPPVPQVRPATVGDLAIDVPEATLRRTRFGGIVAGIAVLSATLALFYDRGFLSLAGVIVYVMISILVFAALRRRFSC